jgi:acyl phosphate:glycerol-3-phosphate acyltransferase
MNPTWMTAFGFGLMGYLIGSISMARIIFAWRQPDRPPPQLRTPTTDGQAELIAHAVGATNVMLAFGARWGLFTTVMDVLKGYIPVLILRIIYPQDSFALVCGIGILIGHLWPVWYRFIGGGGNSSIMGMILAISPLGLVITHGLGMMIGRRFPMFSFLGGIVLAIPWMMGVFGPLSPEAVFALVIALIYVAGQLPEAIQIRNIRRNGHQLDYDHIMRQMRSATKNMTASPPQHLPPTSEPPQSPPLTNSENDHERSAR